MSARLAPVPGEWIDRAREIPFRFEGRAYTGYAGDTISTALHAAGVRALGRSFKYHRMRGILSAANHDINAMMQWDGQPNVRGDVTRLVADMNLRSVNTRGGLLADRLSILDRLSAFMPVGFYYKAFHRPKAWFPAFEHMIRRAAGLGEVDVSAPRVRTPKRNAWCDVLVIGAGPAGLSAARAAANQGARVVLVDECQRPGGSLTYRRTGEGAESALRELVAAASNHPLIEVMTSTTAAGYYADHLVPLVDETRLTRMRARAVVVATGSFEQPAVFRNNDLPGVMLGSAAQRLMYRYAVRPMEQAVVLAGNDRAYEVALDLHRQGILVRSVVELRDRPGECAARQAVMSADIPILTGHCIVEAIPTARRDGVAAVLVAPMNADGGYERSRTTRIEADGIVMSVGFAPAANLLYQAGMRAAWNEGLGQFLPTELPEGVFAAGEVNGCHALPSRLADGERAGTEAARAAGLAVPDLTWSIPAETERPNHPYPIVAHPSGKNFVDFDEDLQLADFVNAAAEGFDNIELLKRYTTVGMGPSQGKHSNMNAIRILARIRGLPIDRIGSTTARPFYHPVPLSHLAGRGFHPERTTALHDKHVALGARFMSAGIWRRPEYYERPNQTRESAIQAEVAAVHRQVALIDVGTLGKLEVYGPDAALFLERVYAGRFAGMRVGTTRYALMTDESGIVMDDGVVARLGEHHFYFTTTTSNSATIYRELSRLNTQWGLSVGIVNLTGAMGAVNLAGPLARDVLAGLTDADLSETGMPFLAAVQIPVAGLPARVMRVGFVGALSYEIHVPTQSAGALWDALSVAGGPHGIVPFGVEAQRVLRLEQGHVIVGQDTDGVTTPFEAGLGFAVKMDKPFFVGQRSLRIHAATPPRQSLVGFVLESSLGDLVPRECHLVIEDGQIRGRVTSVAFSAALGKTVGLAFVTPHMTEVGYPLAIRVRADAYAKATVAKPPFLKHDRVSPSVSVSADRGGGS